MATAVPNLDHVGIGGALSDLVIRTCEMVAQFPSPSSRLAALRDLSAEIHRLRQRLGTSLNQVGLLPRDVLVKILWHAEPEARISAAHTCTRWMELANEAASRFCALKIHDDRYMLEEVPRALGLLGTTPVSVDISIIDSCEILGGFLLQHLCRLQTLRLMVMFRLDAVDRHALVQPLVYALESAAPLLQRIDIYIERPYWIRPAELYLPDDLFAHAAPVLRYVKFDGLNSRLRRYEALSTPRILDLEQTEIDLVSILDFYPQIEQLRAHTRSLVAGRRQINPLNLRLLELRGSMVSVEFVLERLILTRPLSVWMHYVEDDVLNCILSTVPRKEIQRVQFCLEYGTKHAGCVLGFSTAITWILSLSPTTVPGRHILLHAETMANIIDLSFHEIYWPACPSDVIPPALRLARLELVLDSFSAPSSDIYVRQFVEGTATLFYEGRPFALRCPALEEIWISAPAKLSPLAVDVYDLCGFINGNLNFGPTLPRLILRNIHLYDPGIGQGMQLLTGSVSDVTYCPAFVPSIPELHRTGSVSWMYSAMG